MTYNFGNPNPINVSRRTLVIIGSTNANVTGFGLPGSSAWVASGGISQNNWWLQSLMRLNWAYELLGVSYATSRTAAQAVTAFATEVTPLVPQEVWIALGEADMTSAATATSALGSIDTLIANCLQLNRKMIIRLFGVLPGDATSNTTAYQQATATFNYGLSRRAQYDNNIQFIDIGAVARDATSTTGQALSGYIDSGHVSPTCPACALIGDYVANRVNALSPPVNEDYPFGNSDYFGTNANSFRVLQNPTFAGSGGTAGTGVTGTIPAGWSIAAGSGVTIASTVTRDAVPGSLYPKAWINMAFGGTASAQIACSVSATTPSLSGLVTLGTTKMRARVDVKTTSPVNIAGIYLNTQGSDVSFSTFFLKTFTNLYDNVKQTNWPTNFVLEAPTVIPPPGIINWQWDVVIVVQSGNAPTGTVSISQPLWEVIV